MCVSVGKYKSKIVGPLGVGAKIFKTFLKLKPADITHNWQKMRLTQIYKCFAARSRCHLNFINTGGFNNSFLGNIKAK